MSGLLQGLAGFFLLTLIRSLAQGFVVWVMWGWFILPYWPIVAPGILVCAGLALLTNLIVRANLYWPKNLNDWIQTFIETVLLTPFTIIVLGFVFYQISR